MNMNKQTSARYWFIYSKAIKKSRVVGVFLFRILCFNSQLCLVFCTPSPLFIISQQVVISGPKLKENKKETISAELTTLSSFPERSWVFSYHDFFRWRIVLQYWRSFYPSLSAPSWGRGGRRGWPFSTFWASSMFCAFPITWWGARLSGGTDGWDGAMTDTLESDKSRASKHCCLIPSAAYHTIEMNIAWSLPSWSKPLFSEYSLKNVPHLILFICLELINAMCLLGFKFSENLFQV